MAAKDGSSASARAYQHLRDRIVSGSIASGEMLSENDIAQSLEMSRTPVRLALVQLQHEGWVRIYPKRGALVRGLSDDDVRQLLQARLVLETGGVLDLSQQDRTELGVTLKQIVDEEAAAVDAGDWARFATLSLQFHRAFVAAGGNTYLTDFYDQIRDRQAVLLNQSQSVNEPRAAELIDEHRSLAAAVERDDRQALLERLRMHLDDAYGGDSEHRSA
ncbi:GntR family transcriptional regulator [Mycobacterium stomatepiae]|uniref:Putative transcriptional regulator, GntR family protein n=1 Tax=Mycobacterium stomatepiae TaxID=470076 RepID=A0A7I7QH62_9MYCO|nr:GntR family transcriptional regulator [Mycobacterium stomatepiae]MCV7166158.1 GntR family transcriptional regulator [Mycobacterium stomatepiae]BBY25659.1 putative transcriptional regulator, GntR family protein [Mycobacterium stomatepiae]